MWHLVGNTDDVAVGMNFLQKFVMRVYYLLGMTMKVMVFEIQSKNKWICGNNFNYFPDYCNIVAINLIIVFQDLRVVN